MLEGSTLIAAILHESYKEWAGFQKISFILLLLELGQAAADRYLIGQILTLNRLFTINNDTINILLLIITILTKLTIFFQSPKRSCRVSSVCQQQFQSYFEDELLLKGLEAILLALTGWTTAQHVIRRNVEACIHGPVQPSLFFSILFMCDPVLMGERSCSYIHCLLVYCRQRGSTCLPFADSVVA